MKVARGEGVEEKVRNGVGADGLAVAATSELRYARVVVGSRKSDETSEETMVVALESDVRERSNTLHASDGVAIRRRNVQTNVRRSQTDAVSRRERSNNTTSTLLLYLLLYCTIYRSSLFVATEVMQACSHVALPLELSTVFL